MSVSPLHSQLNAAAATAVGEIAAAAADPIKGRLTANEGRERGARDSDWSPA